MKSNNESSFNIDPILLDIDPILLTALGFLQNFKYGQTEGIFFGLPRFFPTKNWFFFS